MATKNRLTDAEALERLETLEPETAVVRDRADAADIRAALQMRQAANDMVDRAVIEARHRGLTWIEIGVALGVSPQAARKKYLERV
ncbi:hypothetical protein [Ruania rhizosphaerae]|uniref:hypothetical protein n=1 Tax=Ruania rhizosphaerae TaxID=1840413 RepID=UPI00135A3B96|nr:hypothetical protein [Ruania rhizosphaerae]